MKADTNNKNWKIQAAFVSLSKKLNKIWARASFCSVTWKRKRLWTDTLILVKVQHMCKHIAQHGHEENLLRSMEQCFLLPTCHIKIALLLLHFWNFPQCEVFHIIPKIDLGFHSFSLALDKSLTICSPAPSPLGMRVTRAKTTRCFSTGISLGLPSISTLKIKQTLFERRHDETWRHGHGDKENMMKLNFCSTYNTHLFCWSILSNQIRRWNTNIP